MADESGMRETIDARADAVRVAYFGEVGTKWEHIGEANREKWRQAVRNVVERETALCAELAHVLALNDALAQRNKAVCIELPYGSARPDGNCGAARGAMAHVPESYDITKLLGYCAALVAYRDAVTTWVLGKDDDAKSSELCAARDKAESAASEAMTHIGSLAPEVVRTLQSERDALKAGIVAFVHGAAPRMPLSLASAVHDLLALVKS